MPMTNALLFVLVRIPSNGIATFGPLIITAFVKDPFYTTLFYIPVGLVHIFFTCGGSFLAMKIKMKGPAIVLLSLLAAIGFLIFLAVPHTPDFRLILLAGYLLIGSYTGISRSCSKSHDEFIPCHFDYLFRLL